MTRTVTIKFILALLVLIPCPRARAAEPSAPATLLLSHGTDQSLWVGQIVRSRDLSEPPEKTVIWMRGAGDRKSWRPLDEAAAQATCFTSRGEELIVGAEGEWRMVSLGGIRSGTPLPDRAVVIELAGEGDALWAIGDARPSTTQPTTSVAVPTSSPATRPASTRIAMENPQLFQLDRGDWIGASLQDIPDIETLDNIPIVVIGGRPLIALCRPSGLVELVTLDSAGALQLAGRLHIDGALEDSKLLNLQGRPVFWAATAPGPGTIWLGGDSWSQPIPLQPGKAADVTERSLAAAFGKLRLLYKTRDGKIFEQAYETTGAIVDAPAEARIPQPHDTRLEQVVKIFLMAAVILVLMTGLRGRPVQETALSSGGFALPTLARRMSAGLIDATPAVLGLAYFLYRQGAPSEGWRQPSGDLVLWAGTGVYILHTLLTELWTQRSLGKILLGLRVIALDGTAPKPRAILLRNLMRIADVVLVFPLCFVLISPLQQRVGDLAAGTLVVQSGEGASADSPPPTDHDKG